MLINEIQVGILSPPVTVKKKKDIPIVWLSPSLEHVSLSYIDSLITLCKNIDVDEAAESRSPQVFPKLKKMRLKYLPNLEIWAESSAGEPHNSVMFPQLEELEVNYCMKLATLPEAPLLTKLACRGYVSTAVHVHPMRMSLGCWPSLVRLDLRLLADVSMSLEVEEHRQGQTQTSLKNLRCMGLAGDDAFISTFDLSKLRSGLGEALACLQELHITDCDDVVRWPAEELRYLHRLRSLYIWRFENLVRISSEEMLSLPLLETLDIKRCSRLKEIQELPTSLEQLRIGSCGSLVVMPSNLGNLSKLRVLGLSDCGGIEALHDGMDGLTSLQELWISSCPRIEEFPPGLLKLIPHLKHLTVQGCPDLQRRCREGAEYFELLSSVTRKSVAWW